MKVLQVINSFVTGGAEKLLLDSIPKYKEKGIDMELLLLNGANQPFLTELKKSNCTIFSLGTTSIYNPFLIFKIVPYLKKYDLIHVHLFPSLYWVAIAKMISFSKTNILFTEHSTHNNRRNNLFYKIVDRFIYSKYKKIITISDEVKYLLNKHLNFNEDKFSTILNGVDIEKVYNATPNSADLYLKSDFKKIVVQVSSFIKQKDQNTLIRSIPFITIPVKLLLIGEGPLINESKKLVKQLNLEDQVSFLGIQMNVPSFLKMADIVVLSTNFEGLSLSSIEGLASGRPFIASDVPGITDVVKGAGILFPVGNEQALADEINKLLSDELYLNEISSKSLRRANRYSLQNMIENHIKLYNNLCES